MLGTQHDRNIQNEVFFSWQLDRVLLLLAGTFHHLAGECCHGS